MAVTVTVTLNRAYEAIMGNKRRTGGTFVISGSYDNADVILTSNTLGLKQAEFFTAEGGNVGTTAAQVAVRGINISGVTLGFLGATTTSSLGLPSLASGTVITQSYQWRAEGY